MNLIRESFLRWLHVQREHDRLDNYKTFDGYYNGDHEIDIPAKVAAALQSELGTVCNFSKLVVDTAVDYILGGKTGLEVKELPEAEQLLYDVYEANYMLGEELLKLVTIMCKKGDVFIKLYIEDGEIKIRVLRPDIVFPRYETDDYTKMMYCAIKWAEENVENPRMPIWKAQVFRPDVVEQWELGESEETEHSEWEFKGSVENKLGVIPVIHVKNTIDDLEFGVSDLQVMTDLQDALNKTITDMLLTMDNQSFQRVFLWGAQTPKGHELSMEPGMITEIPNEQGHMDIVPAAELSPFLLALKQIINLILTVTHTSKLPLVESEVSHPASGFALRVRAHTLELKCMKKIAVLRNRLKELNRLIFIAAKLLGRGDYVGLRTDVHFTSGLPVDDTSQMQVIDTELRSRIKSRKTAMQERGVEDIEAEMEQIRIEEDEQLKIIQEAEVAKAKAIAAAQPQPRVVRP